VSRSIPIDLLSISRKFNLRIFDPTTAVVPDREVYQVFQSIYLNLVLIFNR
jgi:hypothetical protein